MSIFKAYDIRGKYPGDWDKEMAYKIGLCLPSLLSADRILVGQDARRTSPEIFENLAKGINEAGADVIDMGLSTTPMVYFATVAGDYPASVMITASHNPPQYNGMKISRKKAVPVGFETGIGELEKMVANPPPQAPSKGKIIKEEYLDKYAQHLLSFAGDMKNKKAVIDYGNGMVGLLHEKVFARLPITVIPVLSDIDGTFPNHEPNPTIKENLLEISRKIKEVGADFGIAFDGDGDRAVFLDEKGELISPDLIIPILGGEILPKNPGVVLYDVRSSASVPQHIEKQGGRPIMWKVGHAYMKKKLRDENGVLGGELAGHFYFKDNNFCDSGAIAAIIGALAFSKGDKPVSSIIKELNPRSFSGEINFSVEDKDRIIQAIKEKFKDGKLVEIDGIRIEMPDWWFSVRASNTEPLLRLVVEAEDRMKMHEKVGILSAIISGEEDETVKRAGWNDEEAPLELIADTIRIMSAEAIQKANSGHPGLPLGMADAVAVLWMKYLNLDPKDSGWYNRDRFIISGGHGSSMLYSILHLAGFDISLTDLQNFRQLHSKTPGHPELGHTDGVEITTGPLGQGFANGVGMAMASKIVASRAKCPTVINNNTWVIAGDGDLMEGVASEAASMAGHLKLGGLKVLYDDNGISIDGSTDLAFTEDVGARFSAYGWRVISANGHDIQDVDRALKEAKEEEKLPVLIKVKTTIGHKSPNKAGTAGVHGSPLGWDEIKLIKENLQWPARLWAIAPSVRRSFSKKVAQWTENRKKWDHSLQQFKGQNSENGELLIRLMEGYIPENLDELLPKFNPGKGMATRKASEQVLNALADSIPGLIGGSADLTPSNNTRFKNAVDISPKNFDGNYIRYGIREHAMGAIMNGLAAFGGLRPYGGTFMVFADYLRPALRMSALMKLPVIYVLTHDSVFLGEDGPTHQPVCHLASLRAIPNLVVLRPADANEASVAWHTALNRLDGPTVLALTRQDLPIIDQKSFAPAINLKKGAYVLRETPGRPDVILIGTGSELSLLLEGACLAVGMGVKIRVISMPSWELFSKQPKDYREALLVPDIPKMAIEAGSSFGWERWIGDGLMISIDDFGASAPAEVLAEYYGFTPQKVAQKIFDFVKDRKGRGI